MTQLLVDGDILAHQATLRAQQEVIWEDGDIALHSNQQEIIAIIEAELWELSEVFGTCPMGFFLSCPSQDGWRRKVMPSYKMNRTAPKPLGYKVATSYLEEKYGAIREPGLEADDLMGIWATEFPGEYIVVSRDKDLKTIPGKFCRWPDSKEVVEISEEEADYNHLFQAFMGDPGDGYPGCPGVGKKRAKDILSQEMGAFHLWDRIQTEYEKRLGEVPGRQAAWANANVARILRHGEYNFKTKEVTLWSGGQTLKI